MTNSVSDTWNNVSALSVKQKIKYEIGFLGTGGGGETGITYSKSWGEGGSKSEAVTIGSESSVSIPIPPKKRYYSYSICKPKRDEGAYPIHC